MQVFFMKKEEYVGFRLRSERKRLGFTLPSAGDLCGVTGKTIAAWEKGGPIPSDKLIVLWENDFDVYYILTGGRLAAAEASDLEKPKENIQKGKISDNSKIYGNSDTKTQTGTQRPSSGAKLGRIESSGESYSPDEVAALGRQFFNAWTRIFHTHGTEMQSAIMTALKGSDVAHYLVSEQFHETVKDKSASQEREQTVTQQTGRKST